MRRPRSLSCRSGYTLTEIAIVVAIMTALATASWPMLMKPWQRSIVQRDAAMLQEAMQNARLAAISNGHAYQLRWKLGKNEFEIQSRDPVLPQMNRIGDYSPRFSQVDGESQLLTRENEITDQRQVSRLSHDVLVKDRLSDGVTFDSEQTIPDDGNRADALFADDALGDQDSISKLDSSLEDLELNDDPTKPVHDRWSDPIAFHPNGRAENREITLHSEDGYSITLTVRGFTGAAVIGRPTKTANKQITNEQPASKANTRETQRTFAN